MKLFEDLKTRVFGIDPDSVAAYQTVLPHDIRVNVKSDDGVFIAKIQKVDNKDLSDSLLITEAKDMETLIRNVNDLLYTYVDMPTQIRPYYGNIFVPENYNPKTKTKNKELILVKA